MSTSQVYGHHDKMARTKTHRTSQTRSIQRRNVQKEITKPEVPATVIFSKDNS